MSIKRIISSALCASFIFTTCVHASILGSETVKHSRLDIGPGATLETNVFYSDQAGVGYQSEYFVEYTPNDTLVPIVINDSIYGRISASGMAESVTSQGGYPTMLMNSDFFALQTGIPLSHQVTDGRLSVMDSSDMDAIGINEDGTAFISWLSLNASLTSGENNMDIAVFNKLRQPYGIYGFDSQFADTTMANTAGINIVIGSLSDKLKPGQRVEGIVESVTEDEGAVAIPKGKIILSADMNCAEDILNSIRLLKEGDKISISVTADGDVRWNNARHILGAWGGVIVRDSKITDVDEAAAPRSAFGIKEDGTLIFYALDGRISGHSYGARLKTLAKRMLELGCTDAVNLDGGGSTTIGAIYPGGDSFSVINKPSDGSERKVATFVGLVNTASKTGIADRLFVYPYSGNYLSGATETFTAYATDENYYKANISDKITYTAPDGSTSTDGKLTITGDGEVKVSALAGETEGSVTLNCYTTPTYITLRSAKNNSKINTLTVKPGDTIDLNAYASIGNKTLIGDDSCFEWNCSEDIGTITDDGIFEAATKASEGTIKVKAGDYTRSVKVNVTVDNPYTGVNFEKENDGIVSISFDTQNGFELNEENISIKADGKEVTVSLANGKQRLVFSDNKTHKISVTLMNSGGYKTVASYTLDGEEYDNIFADVEDSYWAKKYITYMNAHKVVNGSVEGGKTHFKPTNNITRAEFAVMTANMLGIDINDFENTTLDIDDADNIASWCKNHIKALYELGIMTGKQNDDKVIFDAGAPLTRAEAASVISRLLPDMVEIKTMKFEDENDIADWCREAFKKLTSLGIMNGYSDNTLKPSNKITRAEVIKMLYEIF